MNSLSLPLVQKTPVTSAPWRPAIVRVRDGDKYFVWGSPREDGKSPELQREGYLIQEEIAEAKRQHLLSIEEKRALRASRIVQPIKGTGHKPGEHVTWMSGHAPTLLVEYFKYAFVRSRGFFEMKLRWPLRLDEEIREIAKNRGRVIPTGINFIKSERSLATWGASGAVTVDSPVTDEIREIVRDQLEDMNGNKLKVTEKDGRTKIIDVHFVFQLFFEVGFPLR